ncbi:hypothetical protein MTO96_045074 [Rhipicephalus appendiculatus]
MATNIAIEPPGKMCLTGDLCANWKSFRQRFDLYLTVTDVYNTLDFGEAAPGADRSQVLSVVLEKLDNYFAPEKKSSELKVLVAMQKAGER